MSQQISEQPPVQKRKFDVYSMMLIIAFFAIVTACVLLAYELQRWGSYPWWNTSDAQPAAALNWVDGEFSSVEACITAIAPSLDRNPISAPVGTIVQLLPLPRP